MPTIDAPSNEDAAYVHHLIALARASGAIDLHVSTVRLPQIRTQNDTVEDLPGIDCAPTEAAITAFACESTANGTFHELTENVAIAPESVREAIRGFAEGHLDTRSGRVRLSASFWDNKPNLAMRLT
jgi:hypothetical protein